MAWAPLVILEGVTCTRLAATDRLAYRVWVEAAGHPTVPHDPETELVTLD
jgi:hypothetical protein